MHSRNFQPHETWQAEEMPLLVHLHSTAKFRSD